MGDIYDAALPTAGMAALFRKADEIEQSLLPVHLRDDAPYQTCSRCERHTYDTDGFGSICQMTQPDGLPCGGQFGPEIRRA